MSNRRAFTLIELLVVLAIIGILIGLITPVLANVRVRANKILCMTNLRSIGHFMELHKQGNNDKYPVARSIPAPFLTADSDPPLNEVFEPLVGAKSGGESAKIYHCPGDKDYVYKLCGMSYDYITLMSGLSLDDIPPVKQGKMTIDQIVLCRDYDNGEFDLDNGATIVVPMFHDLRNLLFADGHAGNFQ